MTTSDKKHTGMRFVVLTFAVGALMATTPVLARDGDRHGGLGGGGHGRPIDPGFNQGGGGHWGHGNGGHGNWGHGNWGHGNWGHGHWGHGHWGGGHWGGGRWWRGRWYGYGVGSCWRWTPYGWTWVCY